MIDVRFLQTAAGGTRVRTPKALIRVALNKGRTVPLLQLALYLRHNRKTRRNVGHVRYPMWGLTYMPRFLTYSIACQKVHMSCLGLFLRPHLCEFSI